MGHITVRPLQESRRDYERWLGTQVDGVRREDLDEKHRKMGHSVFVFLRATYWRWAETILALCGDLAGAPIVLGVGDIHLENYGVWRDRDARLVWGVNDFDEASDMPYVVDLVRLATSALVSGVAKRANRPEICSIILSGYRKGLATPRPFVLDEEHMWLRTLFAVTDEERARFWKKMDKLRNEGRIPSRYREPLERALPHPDSTIEKFARRAVGTGSLGRPRWVGIASWRGGRVVREAKAVVPSAWTLTHSRARKRAAGLIAAGRYRAPDPWQEVRHDVVVRRLSPNSRKIEVEDHPKDLGDPDMLSAMGHELANVHLGTGDVSRAVTKDLDRREDRWLGRATERAAEFVIKDFDEWRRSGRS
jgi:uncharacterized protein (DUF2252 family)